MRQHEADHLAADEDGRDDQHVGHVQRAAGIGIVVDEAVASRICSIG